MSQASVRSFQEKQIIFSEGTKDKSLYKIISGKVAFYTNYDTPAQKLIGITTAPNYFGAMNVFSGLDSVYTAVAIERSMILYLPESELETFPKSDAHHALDTMKALAHAAAQSSEKLQALLHELQKISGTGGANTETLNALVDTYSAGIRETLIVDEFTPYTPPKAETPSAPAASPTVSKRIRMPEPYLEGHGDYSGVTHPEYKKYLIPDEYTCPHCHKKFSGSRIQVSKLIPIRDESDEGRYDLRVTYDGFETEWHEIVTCPSCCFSSFDNFFREGKSLYRSRYEKQLAKLCDSVPINLNAERDLNTVFAQHYLALACAPGFTDSRQIIARVWINLVRLYKDAGEPELAEIAEQNALAAYEKVYMEVELTEGQEQRLCLTVAGILYARGEKRAAREWAMRVRTGSGDRSAYWNLAEQLVQDVRAELANE